MNKNTKLFSVISYITWIGWIIAFAMRDRDDKMVSHHVNQALVINIVETIGTVLIKIGGVFGVVGEIVDVAVLVFLIMGIVRACRLSDEPLPVIGDIKLVD